MISIGISIILYAGYYTVAESVLFLFSIPGPGSTKPAFITKRSLKHLSIVVVGGDGGMRAPKHTYNYYKVRVRLDHC